MRQNEGRPVSMIETDDEIPVAEGGQVPEVYSDGPCTAEIHGDIVTITYFKFREISGQEMRVPVLEMTRPLRSCGHGRLQRLIEQASARQSRASRGH